MARFARCIAPLILLILLVTQPVWGEEEESDEPSHELPEHPPHPPPDPHPPRPEGIPGYVFDIFPGPKPTFRVVPTDQHVTVGECAKFYCIPAGAHNPRVEWKVLSPDGEPVVSDKLRVSKDGYQLSVCDAVDSWDKFEIQCCAFWPFGEDLLKASARLHVRSLAAPRIVLEPRRSCKFKWNSRIVLQCAAHGWPLPKTAWRIKFKRRSWKMSLTEDREYKDYIKEPTRLIILSMNPDLEGEYVCIAYNKVGRDKFKAYVGFDRTSVRRPDMSFIVHTVREAYKSYHNFGRESEHRYHKKATCNMEVLNQFGWPAVYSRAVDSLTLTYDYLISKLTSSRHRPENSIPGEALNIDYQLLQYIKNNLNCSSTTVAQPDCNRFVDFNMRYATPDGSCNNFKFPTWGQAGLGFQRFLQSQYEEGINLPQGYQPNRLYCGHPKPSPRLVSLNVLSTEHYSVDPAINQIFNYFGQFIDHDLQMTSASSTDRGLLYNTECNKHCHVDLPCFPIPVPRNDPRIKGCLSFKRSAAFCSSGEFSDHKQCIRPREQINQQTSFFDAGMVYGSTCDTMNRLRDLNSREGFLKTSHPAPGHKMDLLPVDVHEVPTACGRNVMSPDTPCFSSGDARTNEFAGTAIHHQMMVREHNRIAKVLYVLNPHWCPDKLFFETRRIVAAVLQHITFNEYLPLLIGKSNMQNLVQPYNGYNPDVNPTVWNEFASAALRMGHSMISNYYALLDENYKVVKTLTLESLLFAPYHIARNDIDLIVRGFMSVRMKNRLKGPGTMASHAINNLFEHTASPALDLGALNIQRGRDHGLASYNDFRVFCGLKWAHTWEDLQEDIPADSIEKLKALYGAPCNIDLFPGLMLERRVSDSLVGPTATCLIAIQFKASRDGDRFWYENSDVFTPAQVQEIRRYTYSRLVCNTVETINNVQPFGFFSPRQPSDLVPCHELPDMDLNAWRDNDRSPKCMPESPCKAGGSSGADPGRPRGQYRWPSGPDGPHGPGGPEGHSRPGGPEGPSGPREGSPDGPRYQEN